MKQGAIEMELVFGEDVERRYIILPIHEYRNDGPRFRIEDPDMRGAHLMKAADVRGSWNAWVADLVPNERILTFEQLQQQHPKIDVY